MKSIPHRSLAVSFELWEFDPARRVIIATVRFGNLFYDFEKPVCLLERARAGAFVLNRRGPSVWELSARACEQDGDALIAKPSRVHRDIAPMSYLLLGAPDHVCAEIAAT